MSSSTDLPGMSQFEILTRIPRSSEVFMSRFSVPCISHTYLDFLTNGECFLIPDRGNKIGDGIGGIRGERIAGNGCVVRVRYQRVSADGIASGNDTAEWSPYTEVVPARERFVFGSGSIESTSLECPRCNLVCSSKSGLTLHMKSCNGRTPAVGKLVCDWCGHSCSSTSGLTLHRKRCLKRPEMAVDEVLAESN